MTQRSTKRKKTSHTSRKIGLVLCGIQLFVTIGFATVLLQLNILPAGQLVGILSALTVLLVFSFVTQRMTRGKARAGKIVSVLMSILLVFGVYFGHQGDGALRAIAGDGRTVTIDNVVVAVLVGDSAESLQDAAGYVFGVQYAMGGDAVRTAVEELNADLGTAITEREYASLLEQVDGLRYGEVQAIIYNEVFRSLLEEHRPGFLEEIRVIESRQIERVEESTVAAEVDVSDDTFAVFISGMDVFGSIETSGLSDVNMLMVVNPDTHQILLINTPRDYYLPFPGVTGAQNDKLTHAGIYGVQTSMAALSELYGVDIPFYVRVNFTSFIEIIDALGGVDVYSAHGFTSSLGMPVSQGINRFTGRQALEFSRERFNVPGGDIGRGANQQAVISAILRRAMSPAILTGANAILSSVETGMDTNMTYEQIQALIRDQLRLSYSWNMKSVGVDGAHGHSTNCFSMPGTSLFVIRPDMEQVNVVREQIAALQRGEVFVDAEVLE
ncbi:MAG: LCP family protein [Oscillospiraceae bacterium]|nr:LCP family protein [Oscillospiraceae bacterium]